MDAMDLRSLVRSYHAMESELFDNAANILLQEVRKQLEKIMNIGKWRIMNGCTQIGIMIEYMNTAFDKFEVNILRSWILYNNQTLDKDFGLEKFEEFVQKNPNYQFYDFQPKEWTRLKPFVDALRRKGLEVYFDGDNESVIAVFDV